LDYKPPLPPRTSPSPAFGSKISHAGSGAPSDVTPLLKHQRTTKDSLLLSVDLIISTLDYSARQLFNGGAESVGAAIEHKYGISRLPAQYFNIPNTFIRRYGPDARQTSMLLAGTARNIGLVYIDVAGIGRRALLKRAGAHFAKGRLSSD
jgi:spartin